MAIHPSILTGESHRQKSLTDYSSQGRKEANRTVATQHACSHLGNNPLSLFFLHIYIQYNVIKYSPHALHRSSDLIIAEHLYPFFTETKFTHSETRRSLLYIVHEFGQLSTPKKLPPQSKYRAFPTPQKSPLGPVVSRSYLPLRQFHISPFPIVS